MRRLAAVLLVVLAALLVATPASAQDDGWIIRSFDVDLTVEPDGDLLVVETILVDFGSLERRGIFRVIPVRYPLAAELEPPEGSRDAWWRVFDIDDLRVDSPSAPTDTEVERPGVDGTDLRIRIGDPETTITGAHEYRIAYRVRGAMNTFDGEAELYWNATGNGWGVPIQTASAVVSAPAVTDGVCFAGLTGSTWQCASADVADERATFTARDLPPGGGLTVAVRMAPGAVTVPPPTLERRWSLGDALLGSPVALPLAAFLTVAVVLGLAFLVNRQGRDRVARGGVSVTGRYDPVAAGERRRGLLEPRPVPVEFRPPDDLRPGQLGLIVDERVDPVDISATIVDLAVRGHLTIEEVVEERFLRRDRTDWILRKRSPDAGEAETEDATGGGRPATAELLAYERRLLKGLFETGVEVRVSELTGTFATHYQLAEKDLYEDAERRRWFNGRPDVTRTRWLVAGFVALAVAGGLTFLAVRFTRVGIAGLPLIGGGLALMALHRWMPHRTGLGSSLLVRTLGFRDFIATADADRIRFADAEGTFLPYLPYAVMFEEVDRWAEAFAALGVDLSSGVGGWYVGHGTFDAARFSTGISGFSSAASTAVSTAPPSSGGSGFSGGGSSGGGGGGGGGGSW